MSSEHGKMVSLATFYKSIDKELAQGNLGLDLNNSSMTLHFPYWFPITYKGSPTAPGVSKY